MDGLGHMRNEHPSNCKMDDSSEDLKVDILPSLHLYCQGFEDLTILLAAYGCRLTVDDVKDGMARFNIAFILWR